MKKLLVINGKLLDVSSGLHGQEAELLITDGLIEKIDTKIDCSDAEVLDAKGCYVAPGFIDMHIHTCGANRFPEKGDPDADILGARRGSTTVVEAGSVPPLLIEQFAELAAREKTRHYALLGCHDERNYAYHNGPPIDFSHVNPDYYKAAMAEHPGLVRGLKCMCSASLSGAQGYELVRHAKKIGHALGLPVVVHIGRFPPDPCVVIQLLEKGDVITHSYHGKKNISPYEEDGTVKTAFVAARDRGVIIDVGHGSESFSCDTYRKAIAHGYYPDTISTDIYLQNYNGPVYSLASVMSKVMSFGMSLEDVVYKSTYMPAKVMHLPLLGSLKPGYFGDLTLFETKTGSYEIPDSYGVMMHLDTIIDPQKVVLSRIGNSEIVTCDLGFQK